ncbi:hypothetical protein [Halorubrum gandharaense]
MIWMLDSLYSGEEIQLDDINPRGIWMKAEQRLCDAFDLELERTTWWDARRSDGHPVQLKSCATHYSNGEIGRFQIWERQISMLRHGGFFAFLVYFPEHRQYIVAMHMIPTLDIPESRDRWLLHHETMGTQWCSFIEWPDIIPLEAIPFGCRQKFTEYYSEEEVEETLHLQPSMDMESSEEMDNTEP